jgi:hypothetical protein
MDPVVIVTEIRHAAGSDDVFVDGTVDGVEVTGAHTWYSHLYPSPYQTPEESANGCQSDADRQAYLNQLLIDAYNAQQQPPPVDFGPPASDPLGKFVSKKALVN